jgi:hypothetical protein
MQLTDKVIAAAVTKAVDVKLLSKRALINDVEENWRKVKTVVEVALAAADEECESRLDRARAAYDALREAIEIEHGRALTAESERDGVAKTLELLLSESAPQIVPCVDHPVLDVIARAITPAFRHLGPDCIGPAEDVTRESECVEFIDPATGQRFEILVRPISDEEHRP